MSSAELWRRADGVLQGLFAAPEERWASRLEALAAEDPTLHREVLELLDADQRASKLLPPTAPSAAPRHDEELEEAEEARLVGRRVGAYRLLRKIGEGGMGTVFLARRADSTFRKDVAVKIVRGGFLRGDLRRRFRRERQILAALEHAGIGRLLDGGTLEDGTPYLVMEHVAGIPITEYCDRHRASLEQRLSLFLRICEAVRFAHRNLIVHRDLKPSNILVTAEGEPKLLDFGIAKLLDADLEDGRDATGTGFRALTPSYASPEQIVGGQVTTASDVYSLGVLLHELLTGLLPYGLRERTLSAVQRALAQGDPPSPSHAFARSPEHRRRRQTADEPSSATARAAARGARPETLRRSLRGDLDAILLAALRREPAERYGTVDELTEDLRRYRAGQPVSARRGTVRYRVGKFLRRYRLGIGVAAAFLLLLLSSTAAILRQSSRVAAERDIARRERDFAQLERRKAEQISGFLTEIFQHAAPEQSLGREPTAREILDRGARHISRRLKEQPETRATLERIIGGVYASLGHGDEAESFLRRALETHQTLLGSSHPETLASLSALGVMLQARGDDHAAEPLLRRAYELRREVLEPDATEVAVSLYNLAETLRRQGNYQAAEPLLHRALGRLEEAHGPVHEDVALALGGLAELLRLTGRYGEAENLYRRSLAIRRRLQGDGHPDLLVNLNNLGLVLGRQGERAEAEEIFRETVATARRLLGEDHPQVAAYLANLAGTLLTQRRSAEGEEVARQALALEEAIRPPRPGLVSNYLGVGIALHQQERFAEAEGFYRRAREVSQDLLGERHPHSGHPLLWLGRLHLDRGQPRAAEPFFRAALEVWRETLPPGHVFIARTEAGEAACRIAPGKYREYQRAEAVLLRSLEAVRAAEGEDAGFTLWILRQLIQLYQAWERPRLEERYGQQLRKALSASGGADTA